MLAALEVPQARGPIAVVGGGLMGHALAATFLAAGYSTSVYEAVPETRQKLRAKVETLLDEWKGTAGAVAGLRVMESLSEFEPGTQFVVEAVPENLELKQRLFAELEEAAPSAILATNSSVYRVGDAARLMRDKSRAVGTHWWNPPQLIPVVEVIQGAETLPAIVEWTMSFLTACGKSPVHVRKDTPGFIGNRLQHALWREALALVEEGVADAATVDLVVRNTIGLKLAAMGPLENADYVGLDMTRAIHAYVFPALSCASQPSRLLDEAMAAGRMGAKTGKGLLDWPEGRRARVAERLGKHVREQLRNAGERDYAD